MDQNQFKENIIPLQSAMQLLAERMLGDVADAEDVVQDVFVMLWSRRGQLDNVVRLDAYCLQAVRTRCIDLIRSRKTRMEHAEMLRAISDSEVMMELDEEQDRGAMLASLLAELPEVQRKAVEMKYLDGCSTQQIEQTLRMSSGNVYTTISRALQTMRDKLNRLKI